MTDMSSTDSASRIWSRMTARLDESVPDWEQRIEGYGQVRASRERAAGRIWTNDEVFRGLLLSLLSSNTDWDKVERIKADLGPLFGDYSLTRYAESKPEDVTTRIVPWFLERRAGGPTLKARLVDLIDTSRTLIQRASPHGGNVDTYLGSLFEKLDRDPKQLAVALGRSGSPDKLRGFGIPLAAEALRNIGYDLAKPDRHVNRAAGCFGWVEFRKWPDRSARRAPADATPKELLAVMTAVERTAHELEEPVSRFDNALWILCAKGGAWLTNDELVELAKV